MIPFLTEMIVSTLIQYAVSVLAPKGLKYVEQMAEPHKEEFKKFVKEHVPQDWLSGPLEEIIDSTLPFVLDSLKEKLKEGQKINVLKMTSEIMHVAYEPSLDATKNIA